MDTPRPLQSDDVLLLLKLAAHGDARASLRDLASELEIPKSSIALSMQRLKSFGLVKGEGQQRHVDRAELRKFLVHGVRWIAPGRIGEFVLGLPTAHAASPLKEKLRGDDDPVVIPLAGGPVRGRRVSPVHPNAGKAAQRDPKLYRLLAIVDALRIGRARDREVAEAELRSAV